MRAWIKYLKETEEVAILKRFCEWQGIPLICETGPLRIQFQRDYDEGPIDTVDGFVAFVQKAAELGYLRC